MNLVGDRTKQNRLLALHQSEQHKPGLAALILPLTAMDLALAMELTNTGDDLSQEKRCLVLHCLGKLICMQERPRKKSLTAVLNLALRSKKELNI